MELPDGCSENLLDGLLIDLDEYSDPGEVRESIETRPVGRAPQIIRDASSDIIEISSESESESDEDEEEEEHSLQGWQGDRYASGRRRTMLKLLAMYGYPG